MFYEASKDILLEEALDPSFLATFLQPNLLFHSKAQQELINACLIVDHSTEEIILLQEEMQNTLNYYSSILSEADNSVEKFLSPKPSLFARGQFHSSKVLEQSWLQKGKIVRIIFYRFYSNNVHQLMCAVMMTKMNPILKIMTMNYIFDNFYNLWFF